MASATVRRIIRGVGANGYSQLVSILVQIVSVPLFLSVWSLEQYGQWLLLAAIPAYLAMSDFGIVMISANRVTILLASGNIASARRALQSSQAFLTVVSTLVAVFSAVILLPPFLPMAFEQRYALLFLILALICGQVGGLAESVFRSTQRFATGVAFGATARLIEWVGYCVGLWLGGSFVAVALGGLIARVVVTGLMLYRSTVGRTDLQYGLSDASIEEVRVVLRPALSYMAFTLSNALTFQGLTIVAGLFLGPAQLVVFNTYRTISRVAVQITSTLSHAVWPEFSRLFGGAKSAVLELAYRRTLIIGMALALGMSVATLVSSPLFLGVWTHQQVEFDLPLMVVFVLYAAVAGTCHTPRVLLMSTNSHNALGIWAVAVSVLSLAVSLLLANFMGLFGIVWAMVAGEVVLLIVTTCLVRRFIKFELRKEEDVLAN